MGEHRRTKSKQSQVFPIWNPSKLQRTYLMVGITFGLGNTGFSGALLDGRSAITTGFDWIAIAALLLSLSAALLIWFTDGLFARYVALGASSLGGAVGLLGLWLLIFQRGVPQYPRETSAVIFAICVIVLSFLSFSATRLILAHPEIVRS